MVKLALAIVLVLRNNTCTLHCTNAENSYLDGTAQAFMKSCESLGRLCAQHAAQQGSSKSQLKCLKQSIVISWESQGQMVSLRSNSA